MRVPGGSYRGVAARQLPLRGRRSVRRAPTQLVLLVVDHEDLLHAPVLQVVELLNGVLRALDQVE